VGAASFLIRRLLLALGVLLAVSFGTFVFFATKFYPTCSGSGQPIAGSVSNAASAYLAWLKGVPTGGVTVDACGNEIGSQTWQALGHTAVLLGLAGLIVVVLSLLLGVVGASRAGSFLDQALRGFAYLAWAVPAFLVALILQSVLNWAGSRYGFHLFALEGWPGQCALIGGAFLHSCGSFGATVPPAGSGLHFVANLLRHLTLPAVSLALGFVGVHSRYLRSSLLVALNAPYTTTARAKGLPEHTVILRHALRNSLATFTSALLVDFGAIFGAALAIDFVFRLNGLGMLFLYDVQSANINPYAVQLLLTVTAAMVLLASLLSEVTVVLLDPRARLR
jgi:peptide/nickel transport system permease protein